MNPTVIWTSLIVLIFLLMAFDLLVLNQKGKHITNKRAAIETIFWVSMAFVFSGVLYWLYNAGYMAHETTASAGEAYYKYTTGYLIELSLSVDNLFVIAMIFASFKIHPDNQHKALFWGIIGAIVLRGFAIVLGVELIERFDWMTYVFGAFLLFTAFKMLMPEKPEDEEKAGESRIHKIFKISKKQDGDKFWIIDDGIRMATPLFAALVMIELTDLLFALDSIPAIISITEDPFIVFSSNIFAILGLRSMYFFLANMLKKFHYIKYSVFAILLFVAIKLLLSKVESLNHVMEWLSLPFIGMSLIVGILVSLKKSESPDDKPIEPEDLV